MGSLSIWHWVIVLLIVMLVFGTKRLRTVGSDLGGAIKGFKEGMKESQAEDKPSDVPLQHLPEGQTIEGEIRERVRV